MKLQAARLMYPYNRLCTPTGIFCTHPARPQSPAKSCMCVMQIMKLVDKVDSAINKLRSLTHYIGKKPKEGPCTLKLKVT